MISKVLFFYKKQGVIERERGGETCTQQLNQSLSNYTQQD
jgi:hypothetical protein